jgi:ABC-type phosphate/phosphonate transport system substrate-binding protein
MTAYLGFYDPDFAHAANDALWAILRDHARNLGLPAPETLDRVSDYRQIWQEPDLAFAQTCGLPLITALAGKVRLLATPVYDFPGCEGPRYSSLIIVRADAPYAAIADLRGSRAAFNARDSQSGTVALHHTIAASAGGKAFFVEEIETGAHLESLRAVAEGRADVCACDCVTFGLVARHRPEWIDGLRVITRSEMAPAPPFVTHGSATNEEVELWREVLRRCIDDPRSAAPRAFLGLRRIEILPLAAYDRIKEMAETAGVAIRHALT